MTAPAALSRVTCEAWEGGGFLGHSYGPIMEYLDEHLIQVREHAGTSAGAITAYLRALRLPARRIRQLQEETPWREFARYHPPALWRLARRGGWHSLAYARRWLEERALEAGLRPTLTFAGLKRATGHRLVVVATRYLGRADGQGGVEAEPYVFQPETSGEAPVVPAVLASMAVPIFYEPVEISGWWFADGGAAVNHPLDVFAHRPPETILGARLDEGREILADLGQIAPVPRRPRVRQILGSLVGMIRREACRAHMPEELWCRVIRIDVGAERALDFRATPERIARLRSAGEFALTAWLATAEAPSPSPPSPSPSLPTLRS